MNSDELEKIKQYTKMTKHELTHKMHTLLCDNPLTSYDLWEEELSWKKMKKAELIIQLTKYEEELKSCEREEAKRIKEIEDNKVKWISRIGFCLFMLLFFIIVGSRN